MVRLYRVDLSLLGKERKEGSRGGWSVRSREPKCDLYKHDDGNWYGVNLRAHCSEIQKIDQSDVK